MHFERVTKIEAVGIKNTYDVIVPDYNNFYLANGILTHNSGKTTTGAAMCAYWADLTNSKFGINNIVWTPEQFSDLVDKSEPYTPILWDEFVLGGLSSDAMTSMQGTIIKKMTMIRKKRLFIILIIPYIFMTRPYFLSRMRLLLHSYTPDGIKRGYFKFYNYQEKNQLYFYGKKTWNYNGATYSFAARQYLKTLADVGIDEEEYEKRKDDAILMMSQKDDKVNKYTDGFCILADYIKENERLTYEKLKEKYDLPLSTTLIASKIRAYKSRTQEKEVRAKLKGENDLKSEIGDLRAKTEG